MNFLVAVALFFASERHGGSKQEDWIGENKRVDG